MQPLIVRAEHGEAPPARWSAGSQPRALEDMAGDAHAKAGESRSQAHERISPHAGPRPSRCSADVVDPMQA